MRTIVFLLAAVNTPRLLAALPVRGRSVAAVIAAAVSLVVLVAVAAFSGPILEAIDVSPSTFRIAAGVVMLAGGVVRMLDPVAAPEPEVDGWRGGLVPVTFPLLLTPDVVLLAIAAGADEGVLAVASGAAVAVGLLVIGASVRRPTSAVVVGLARLLAAVLVIGGVALAVDGIQDL